MIRRSTDKPMNKFSFKGMSIALGIRDIIKPPHKILHQILHKIDLIKPGAVILDYGCGPGNCTIAAAAELVSPPGKVYA
jgi:ubiquinone/menaquinone biosynthesis C-methylase UbiE